MKKINRTISDEELLMAYCQKKDIEYWGLLYERYVPMIYGVALKYLKNEQDAQDAVMQIFEDLTAKKISASIRSFKLWLYVCVRNYCLMELRRRSSQLSFYSDEDVNEFFDEFNPDRIREEAAKEKILLKCIETLPEKQRISICRFYMEDRSYKDIEDATGFSLKLIKSLIQNGKRNLRLCLEKKGIL